MVNSLNAPSQSNPSPVQTILAQMSKGGGANIAISGFEFDFVRSIGVWEVRRYSHQRRGRDGDFLHPPWIICDTG